MVCHRCTLEIFPEDGLVGETMSFLLQREYDSSTPGAKLNER